MRTHRLALAFLLLTFAGSPATHAQEWTMRVEVDGRVFEGWPAAHNRQQVVLLARDGVMWNLAASSPANYERVSNRFRPYSSAEMRSRLAEEFTGRLVVSGAGPYLVAHPAGQRDLWPDRFNSLYRSFVHYWSARGLRPEGLRFPLVAVVFANRQDFARYAAQNGVRVSAGMLGYYSPITNRVLMYDFTDGHSDDAWYVNAETIIHEAAHQAAFNTGIHSRMAMPPKWAVEGLGTLFEARGVWDSLHNPAQSQRVNRNQLAAFRAYLAQGRPEDSLARLISSDRAFNVQPLKSYSEAWALTFYLSENEPRRYWQYLQRTAQIEPLTDYTSQDRMRDFIDVFGSDLRMLDARMRRFIEGL